jgi:hypothetical protein
LPVEQPEEGVQHFQQGGLVTDPDDVAPWAKGQGSAKERLAMFPAFARALVENVDVGSPIGLAA